MGAECRPICCAPHVRPKSYEKKATQQIPLFNDSGHLDPQLARPAEASKHTPNIICGSFRGILIVFGKLGHN